MNNLDKRYSTRLSESHRPDLEPNGKVVRCIEDKGDGYLVVTTDEQIEPNTWLINEKYLTEINDEQPR
jgi:hypothetical protein